MEATKVIASMPPGQCLSALQMLYIRSLQFPHICRVPKMKCLLGALALSKTRHTGLRIMYKQHLIVIFFNMTWFGLNFITADKFYYMYM